MKTEPQKEHQWLQKLVGEWTYEGEATMEPGEPPAKMTGTESVRSLGGLWILAEVQGEMPGGGVATTMMTLGYDPQKRRYVGTWIDSMMTRLWVYEGALDAAERVHGTTSVASTSMSLLAVRKVRDSGGPLTLHGMLPYAVDRLDITKKGPGP